MSHSKAIIRLEDIHDAFAKRTILHDIHLNIYSGELLTIVGPNGAGKSTLTRIILGLHTPLKGKRIADDNLTMAYVPQNFAPPHDLPITAQRFLRGIHPDRYTPLLEQFHIAHLIHTPLQQLSGGETQRLLMVRALSSNAQLIVLDEPAAGIDPLGLGEYYRLIREDQITQGRTVVMVSHDLHFVMAQSDRVVYLNGGICCSARPQEMINHPDFKNLLQGDIEPIGFFTHCAHEHQHEHGL